MRGSLSLWLMLITLVAQAEVLDDPMRPPGYALSGAGKKALLEQGWHLSAIRIDAGHRMAIINGRTLEVGGWVNRARLVEILPQQVRLEGPQGRFSVRLVTTKVKTTRVVQHEK